MRRGGIGGAGRVDVFSAGVSGINVCGLSAVMVVMMMVMSTPVMFHSLSCGRMNIPAARHRTRRRQHSDGQQSTHKDFSRHL